MNPRTRAQIALPFADRPAWLDGSLPGDRGFDPFALGKKSEYLQFDLDSLDGSAAKNPSGNVIGKVKGTDNKPQARALAVRVSFEYIRVFFLYRFASRRSRTRRRAVAMVALAIGYRGPRDRSRRYGLEICFARARAMSDE